ncbi:MAG: hypothetical protein JXR51_08180 [Bacteroidales bacterium]|nr:hypothetical protein [Bacteroidales bacterium]MBN2757138.1 hypothetical protein [Bacteroidales bacterium]
MKNLKLNLLLLTFVFFIFSCASEGTDENSENDSTSVEADVEDGVGYEQEVQAICIWSSLTVKATPNEKGKYITSINLGEVATTHGIISVDSSTSKPREYVNITLADGTSGWVQKNFIAIDSKAFVVKGKTKIYKRPDILTATKNELDRMQFLVSTEFQEGWIKIKAKRKIDNWFIEGWVKSDHLTDNQIDVTVAILVQRALDFKDKAKRIDALTEIKDNADFSASVFIKDIEELLYDLMTEEAEQPIENEEMGD